LRIASIFFFHGFKPVGVSQKSNQSVSLTVHSHFKGLTVKPSYLVSEVLCKELLIVVPRSLRRYLYHLYRPPLQLHP
jgi:hypothetical protein